MKTSNIRSLVFTALFAALFIVLSMQQMRLTVTPVPITFQTFAVILAGLFLRPRQAFLSIFVVIVLAALGLPLFGGKGGLSHLLGATGGFIAAFPFCAMLISITVERVLTKERFHKNKLLLFILLFLIFELFSALITYVPGIPWLMNSLELSFIKAMSVGFYPFIIGDLIKSLLGAAVAIALAPYIIHFRSLMNNKQPKDTSISS